MESAMHDVKPERVRERERERESGRELRKNYV